MFVGANLGAVHHATLPAGASLAGSAFPHAYASSETLLLVGGQPSAAHLRAFRSIQAAATYNSHRISQQPAVAQRAHSCFGPVRLTLTCIAVNAAAGGARLEWDSPLYVSGGHAAVLVMAAFQAPPSQQLQQVYAAAAADCNSCSAGSAGGGAREQRSKSISLLFSDNCGGAAHVTAPAVPTAAGGAEAPAAAVNRWQPHDGRWAPYSSL